MHLTMRAAAREMDWKLRDSASRQKPGCLPGAWDQPTLLRRGWEAGASRETRLYLNNLNRTRSLFSFNPFHKC
jgi:hypothetical protein